MRSLAAVLAVVLFVEAGCSFVAIRRLPGDHRTGDVPDCTSSYAMPGVDAVAAILLGVSSVTLLSTAEDESDFRRPAWVALGATLGFLVAATYGSRQVLRCRRAEATAEIEAPPPVEPLMPGTTGATCKDDKDCSGALVCDETMRTCIPVDTDDQRDLPQGDP